MSKNVYRQKIYIESKKCVECGACTAVCSTKALCFDTKEWKLEYDIKKCKGCMLCIGACPLRAISSDSEDLPSAAAAAL